MARLIDSDPEGAYALLRSDETLSSSIWVEGNLTSGPQFSCDVDTMAGGSPVVLVRKVNMLVFVHADAHRVIGHCPRMGQRWSLESRELLRPYVLPVPDRPEIVQVLTVSGTVVVIDSETGEVHSRDIGGRLRIAGGEDRECTFKVKASGECIIGLGAGKTLEVPLGDSRLLGIPRSLGRSTVGLNVRTKSGRRSWQDFVLFDSSGEERIRLLGTLSFERVCNWWFDPIAGSYWLVTVDPSRPPATKYQVVLLAEDGEVTILSERELEIGLIAYRGVFVDSNSRVWSSSSSGG